MVCAPKFCEQHQLSVLKVLAIPRVWYVCFSARFSRRFCFSPRSTWKPVSRPTSSPHFSSGIMSRASETRELRDALKFRSLYYP